MKVYLGPAHEVRPRTLQLLILPQIYPEEPEMRNPVPDQRFICVDLRRLIFHFSGGYFLNISTMALFT